MSNYIDQADFTNRVYAYVCKLNPIKFYNEIYRYHVEEITPKPIKDDRWNQSCDIYFEFKNKALEKSKKKREENRAKLNLSKKPLKTLVFRQGRRHFFLFAKRG